MHPVYQLTVLGLYFCFTSSKVKQIRAFFIFGSFLNDCFVIKQNLCTHTSYDRPHTGFTGQQNVGVFKETSLTKEPVCTFLLMHTAAHEQF